MLAGCVRQSSSYYVDDGNQHSLSVRAEQEYFWSDEVIVKLAAARLPECQRLFPLTTLPIADFHVELFGAGENVYSLRAGKEVWRVETAACTRLTDPTEAELGTPLGTFRLDPTRSWCSKRIPGARHPAAGAVTLAAGQPAQHGMPRDAETRKSHYDF